MQNRYQRTNIFLEKTGKIGPLIAWREWREMFSVKNSHGGET
jgi:hypothetical protein